MLDNLILSHKLWMLYAVICFSLFCSFWIVSIAVSHSCLICFNRIQHIFISNVVFCISKSSIDIFFFFTSSNSLLFYNLVFLSLLTTWDIFTMAVLETLPASFIITALWVCFFYFSTIYRSFYTPCTSHNLFIGCQIL